MAEKKAANLKSFIKAQQNSNKNIKIQYIYMSRVKNLNDVFSHFLREKVTRGTLMRERNLLTVSVSLICVGGLGKWFGDPHNGLRSMLPKGYG